MNKITMLGTGKAAVSEIYNTCFLLDTPCTKLMVDAGGGNGVLGQMKKVGVEIADIHMQCFDIHSTKEKLFGFRAELPSNEVLACLGDEPYNEQIRQYVEHADWMMCEAFCLYADRDTFKPYEKCHSPALDAGKLAAENFKGRIVVPDDLEEIEL